MDMIGLYPTWFEPGVGSGWIVGLIATIHVLFSHTSVGAAIFFAYLANYAHRNQRPDLLAFIRQYGLFLLVFSYVLGSITGPGIWYSTTVASPRGISALIHNFVWMWATEWVFFVIEVVGVYMLVYLANKLDGKTYLKLSFIFGLTSYTTMLAIIGILSFMMWPGKQDWYEEGGFLNAFYGPNTFAQLGMRTAFMFTMTAVVGGIVAARFKDAAFKKDVATKLAWLGMGSAVAGAAMFQWYLSTLPETAALVMQNRLPGWFKPGVLGILAGTVAYFGMTLVQPRTLVSGGAALMTVAMLVFGLWPEEVARESMRKPWVAGQYVFSNQVIGRDVPGMGVKSEIPLLEAHGFMKTQVFMPEQLRTITDANRLEAGRVLALTTCSNCHSLSTTGIRPLKNYFTPDSSVSDVATYLQAALSTGNTLYMPQIPLKDDEALALATFIATLNAPVMPPATAANALSAPKLSLAAMAPVAPAKGVHSMTPDMLHALRDPAGVPSHPIVFLILGVLTFALHIAAVQVMLGTGALTLRGAFSANAHWRRLAVAMLTTSKIAVSVAIVLGVAPLLFVQVVYDPFWYTSNVLSAWWVMGFIALLIAGYIALYIFYWKNHDIEAEGGKGGLWLVLSLALLLAVGFIVHSLTNQMLFPEQWMAWYAPNGVIIPDGHSLHYWNLPRFGFFIALSAPVTGAWLYAYRRYLQASAQPDATYLAWLAPLAQKLMLLGGMVAVLLGAWWMATLPDKMAWFALSPMSLIALLALLGTVAMPLVLKDRINQGLWGYAVFGAGAVALIVVGAAREVLRYVTLAGRHGYDALDYRISMDWYSTGLFFTTFGVLGSVVLGYLITVAWQAGQTQGTYSPSPALNRVGNLAIGLLSLWILTYFSVGFYVWAR